jgi:hypothetical protein
MIYFLRENSRVCRLFTRIFCSAGFTAQSNFASNFYSLLLIQAAKV